ncbi:Maltose-binding periplasmic protein precursor [Streptomyces sp. ADI96-02]|uniref:ABC transporter substrate-binding protein n=1 Tax=Streptomyces sp. ADI96-02 TaxID=1522760 RepID=UPI000F552E0B|nr:ABC transporter substrate-binding protein [Streptomyces sp. ADI96-02]RPK54124.1 Maltose-binding periplasmic protein precursor [Streptomyces sp. ADI96-02]
MNAVDRMPGAPTRRGVLRGGGAIALTAAAGAALSGCGADDGMSADGTVRVDLWHGQADSALAAIKRLVADFEATHPKIRVGMGGGVIADAMLQKVTAGLASDSVPDIAYIFGSDLASIARSPKLVDLTDHLRDRGDTPWKQYWPAARDAVTVDGKVRAAPALLDSLAVVCNKKVFDDAGVPLPEDGWSWQEFTDTAKKLTDTGSSTFGTGWPGAGDEDTVWRMWPLIWELGGDVIAPRKREIGFAGEPGVRALEVVRTLVEDESVYVDPKPGGEQMYQVFASGRMGMVVTGPWQLPDIRQAKVDYHVVRLPSFKGSSVTISGPDTWAVFDNGPARLKAARTLISWLMEPEQNVLWDVEAGSLPLSRTMEKQPQWIEHTEQVPGLAVFTAALETARVRPVDPSYPQISKAFGEAVISVLLGRSTPENALRACADKANAALAKSR